MKLSQAIVVVSIAVVSCAPVSTPENVANPRGTTSARSVQFAIPVNVINPDDIANATQIQPYQLTGDCLFVGDVCFEQIKIPAFHRFVIEFVSTRCILSSDRNSIQTMQISTRFANHWIDYDLLPDQVVSQVVKIYVEPNPVGIIFSVVTNTRGFPGPSDCHYSFSGRLIRLT